MTKTARFLLLLMVLVIAVAVLSVSILQRKNAAAPEPSRIPAASDGTSASAPPQGTDTPDSAPDATASPEETPAVESPAPETSPEPTEEPVFETRPPVETEEPAETPAPTPEPVDVSGSFASDTGTALNLLAEWNAYTDAFGKVMLRVSVSAESYSFFASGQRRGLILSVNGKTAASADCPEISYDGREKILTPMAEFVLDAPVSGSEISLRWLYRGTYSGKELEDITASGVIEY